MKVLRRVAWTAVIGVALAATLATAAAREQKDDKDQGKPKIVLKAQPMISMAPAKIVLTAELVGGKNDFEEYYCPAVEWDWGDGTTSEASTDCQPYESGKSEIKRRFTVAHVFTGPGSFRVLFRMKKNEKAVGFASAQIQVRPGLRDLGGEGK